MVEVPDSDNTNTNTDIYLEPLKDFGIDEVTNTASLSDQGKGTVLKGMFKMKTIRDPIIALANNADLQNALINAHFEEVTRAVNKQLENPESRQRLLESIATRTASSTGEDNIRYVVVTIKFPEPEPSKLVVEDGKVKAL